MQLHASFTCLLWFVSLYTRRIRAEVFHAFPDKRCQDEKQAAAISTCRTGGESFTQCIASLRQPGDECRLHAGRYPFQGDPLPLRGLHGTEKAPFVIAAFSSDEQVVLDGTVPVTTQPWTSQGDHIFAVAASQDVWQLFVDGEMQTNARWPNALWRDKSVFNVSYWAKSANSSTNGVMIDDGSKGLAESGMDVTGAVAILNTGSFDTYPEIVLHHEKGSSRFTYNATGQRFQKPSMNRYFLEDMFQFLDQPTEWFYDTRAKKIYLWPDNGKDPTGRDIRGKVSTYALNITDCHHVVFANMTFFATTIWAASLHDDNTIVDSLQFRSINFSYPSYSRRMLGEANPPLWMLVSSEPVKMDQSTGRWAYSRQQWHEWKDLHQTNIDPSDEVPGHHVFYNCTWMYTDGQALEHSAFRSSFINNCFAYNDWSAANVKIESGGVGTINSERGLADNFVRNTFFRNGASAGYRPPAFSTIIFNRFISQCWGDIQHDGSGMQIMVPNQNGTVVSYTWVHDSVKYGIRFDGQPPRVGMHGTMLYNVAWRTGGLMIKGDYHTVEHNLAFDVHKEDDVQGADCTICVLTYVRTNPVPINNHTLTAFNVADKINGGSGTGHPGKKSNTTIHPLPGKAYDNVQSNIRGEVRDADNQDFRPRSNSSYRLNSVGPYNYSERSSVYWIPGRQLFKASSPVPPDGSSTVSASADSVMWLQANPVTSQSVTFSEVTVGQNGCSSTLTQDTGISQTSIDAVTNVFYFPAALKMGTTYCWRVDTIISETIKYTGDVWMFKTSH